MMRYPAVADTQYAWQARSAAPPPDFRGRTHLACKQLSCYRERTAVPDDAACRQDECAPDSIYQPFEAIRQKFFIERDRCRLARFPLGDQPGIFERAPVMAKESEADAQFIGYLRPAHLVFIRQHLDNAQPRRIGQRFEYAGSLLDADLTGCGRSFFHVFTFDKG
jgi:hypothetical protein